MIRVDRCPGCFAPRALGTSPCALCSSALPALAEPSVRTAFLSAYDLDVPTVLHGLAETVSRALGLPEGASLVDGSAALLPLTQLPGRAYSGVTHLAVAATAPIPLGGRSTWEPRLRASLTAVCVDRSSLLDGAASGFGGLGAPDVVGVHAPGVEGGGRFSGGPFGRLPDRAGWEEGQRALLSRLLQKAPSPRHAAAGDVLRRSLVVLLPDAEGAGAGDYSALLGALLVVAPPQEATATRGCDVLEALQARLRTGPPSLDPGSLEGLKARSPDGAGDR